MAWNAIIEKIEKRLHVGGDGINNCEIYIVRAGF